MESQINSIFNEEWFAQYAKIDKSRTLDQVHNALVDYCTKQTRVNEIKAIIGKSFIEIDLNYIANNVTPGEIINNYPGRVQRDLDKFEMILKDFQSR